MPEGTLADLIRDLGTDESSPDSPNQPTSEADLNALLQTMLAEGVEIESIELEETISEIEPAETAEPAAEQSSSDPASDVLLPDEPALEDLTLADLFDSFLDHPPAEIPAEIPAETSQASAQIPAASELESELEAVPETEATDWSDLLALSPELVIGTELNLGFQPVVSETANSQFDLNSIDLALSDPDDQTLADFTADPFDFTADFTALPSAKPVEAVEPVEPEPTESEPVEAVAALAPSVEIEPLQSQPTQSQPTQSQPGQIPAVEPPETVALSPVSDSPAPDFNAELDADTFAQLDLLLAEPPAAAPLLLSHSAQWTLGFDLGTTGISAVLLDQTTYQLYPLYWQDDSQDAAKKQFRLSTTVTAQQFTRPTASPLDTLRADADSTLCLSDWKPYLNMAIPHHSPQTSQWEPVLQWSETQTLALRTIQEVLQQLLLSLTQPAHSPACRALGLSAEGFQAILSNLSSVVVGYPGSASDTYSFNLREAILQAGLVTQPGQILFVEEAIAALLSALPAANGERLRLTHSASDEQSPDEQSNDLAQDSSQGHLHNADWQGCTLVLAAGASLSELLLVTLPAQHQTLNPTDFYLRSLPYAGEGLDQDIICQLLYPMLAVPSEGSESDQPAIDRQADFETEGAIPEDLLAGLVLPDAADLASSIRYQLRQRLIDSTAGQDLLNAARVLKTTLQYQNYCSLQIGERLLSFERRDLTSRVLLPYVQRLNRDLNALLAQTNTTAATVNQVICTGGTASLNAVARWLRQKLPNATIIQDTYARPPLGAARFDHSTSSCSRIAYGLAALTLHPQVLDQSRHRYSDYFLLKTLLQVVSPQPQPLDAILAGLEQQGIDTQLCRLRILALLEGYLPSGLVPSPADRALLTAASAANPDYQAIQLAPLFQKSTERHYAANRAQWDYLHRYLESLLADAEQRLDQLEMPQIASQSAPRATD